jgi:hypothetical protein
MLLRMRMRMRMHSCHGGLCVGSCWLLFGVVPFCCPLMPATTSVGLANRPARGRPASSTQVGDHNTRQPFSLCKMASRLAVLLVETSVLYGVLVMFSWHLVASWCVHITAALLVFVSSVCCLKQDWRLLRLLSPPTVAVLVITAAIHLSVLDPHWYLYVVGALGFFLSELIVMMSVFGSDPIRPRLQYVMTAVGMACPMAVCLIGVVYPHSTLYNSGIFTSIMASSFNLLFNKA